jgi:protoporphyrinogen/coproporphyrinogen III oxidase
VRTLRMGATAVDVGAGFMTTFHRRTLALVRDVGLEADLVRLRPHAALVHDGRLTPLNVAAFLPVGGLLPPRALLGILRLIATSLRHRRELDPGNAVRAHRLDDRSVEDWKPQLSRELVDRLVDPVLRSFLYSRAEDTSRALVILLIRAALEMRRILTLRQGLGSLAYALATTLPVQLRTVVRHAGRSGRGWRLDVRRDGADATLLCDQLVLAVPGDVAGTLLDGESLGIQNALQAVTYRSARVTVVPSGQMGTRPFGSVIVPPASSRRLALVSAMSVLNPTLVEPGREVLLLYGVEGGTSHDDRRDDTLLAEGRRLLPGYFAGADPQFLSMFWSRAVPEFAVGRMRLLRQLDHAALARLGLVLAGDYLNGPLMEGAVRSGEAAAERLLKHSAAP